MFSEAPAPLRKARMIEMMIPTVFISAAAAIRGATSMSVE